MPAFSEIQVTPLASRAPPRRLEYYSRLP